MGEFEAAPLEVHVSLLVFPPFLKRIRPLKRRMKPWRAWTRPGRFYRLAFRARAPPDDNSLKRARPRESQRATRLHATHTGIEPFSNRQ